MKQILLGVSALIFLGISVVSAQNVHSSVESAIRSGNATALAGYFHSSVDLTISPSEGTYSKAQAQQIVSDFFTTNKPTGYTAKHNGESGDQSKYYIGSLSTSKGSYRVYILYKNIGGKELIQTLRFELQD